MSGLIRPRSRSRRSAARSEPPLRSCRRPGVPLQTRRSTLSSVSARPMRSSVSWTTTASSVSISLVNADSEAR